MKKKQTCSKIFQSIFSMEQRKNQQIVIILRRE